MRLAEAPMEHERQRPRGLASGCSECGVSRGASSREVGIAEGFAGDVLAGVDHVPGERRKAVEDDGEVIGGDTVGTHGFAHVFEPAASGGFVDDEGVVAATEAGVAVLFGIDGATAEPLFEEEFELVLAWFEVLGVDGAQGRVGFDAAIEVLDDGVDGVGAADVVQERSAAGHASSMGRARGAMKA